MGTEMPSKIMDYSELFTELDNKGRVLTKVEISVLGDGDSIRGKIFSKNAPTDTLLFRGLTVSQLKGKKIRVFVQDTTHTLGDLIED